VVEEIKDLSQLKWHSYIPATARVRSTMNGKFDATGKLVADAASKPSAGAFEASLGRFERLHPRPRHAVSPDG
jgi:hypothetical protein